MKLNFPIPKDEGVARHFCTRCQKETISEVQKNNAPWYTCVSCGHATNRVLAFGKNALMHRDDEDILWHESVAVFVFDLEGKILCFERTRFPVGKITVPAGHAESDKTIEESARMELEEESGIAGANLSFLVKEKIYEDSCSWGADDHVWHVYTAHILQDAEIRLNHEGKNALWLSPRKILEKDCSVGVRFFIQKYFI